MAGKTPVERGTCGPDNGGVTIRARLLLSILLLGGICTGAGLLIVHGQLSSTDRDIYEQRLQRGVALVQQRIDAHGTSLANAAVELAEAPLVEALLRGEAEEPPRGTDRLGTAAHIASAEVLLVLDSAGTLVMGVGDPSLRDELAAHPSTLDRLDRGSGSWWLADTSSVLRVSMAPVSREDERLGVLLAARQLPSLETLRAATACDLGLVHGERVLDHTFDEEAEQDALAVLVLPQEPGSRRVAVGGRRYLMQGVAVAPRPEPDGPRVAVLVPIESGRATPILRRLAVLGAIGSLLAALLLWLHARSISLPLERLVSFARGAAEGDLRPTEQHTTVPEIAVLEDALNDWLRQQERLFSYREEAARSLRDREIDRWIQQSMVPVVPEVPGYDLAVGAWRAPEAGGDCCEIIPADNDSVWVAVGEVATRGLRAGMLATLVHGSLEAAVATAPASPPSRVLDALDGPLSHYLQRVAWSDVFVALRLLRLGPDGSVAFAGAQEEMLLLRTDETACEALDWRGIWLGLGDHEPGADPDGKLRLAAGDTLVLFTDGLLAAQDDSGRPFGTERVQQIVQQAGGQPSRVIRDRLMESWKRRSVTRHDDATVVVIRRKAGSADHSVTL